MEVGLQILELLVRTATWIFIVALVARFLAQMARADFYNPLAQTVIKITNPTLMPLRRIIPGLGGMDISALILVFIAQMAFAAFSVYVVRGASIDIVQLASWSALAVAGIIMEVLRWSMIIVAISSWIAAGNPNPMLGFMTQMIEPFVAPFRKLNIQVGMLDLTYLVVFLVIIVVKDILLLSLAGSLGYAPQLRLFIGL